MRSAHLFGLLAAAAAASTGLPTAGCDASPGLDAEGAGGPGGKADDPDGEPPAVHIDLERLQPLDPEAAAVAADLKNDPEINPSQIPWPYFSGDEYENAVAHPDVTEHAKAVLERLAHHHADAAGRPLERSRVRALLLAGGAVVVDDPYPPDRFEPPAVLALRLLLPFRPGTEVACIQGNNTMADGTTHEPGGLRYAVDLAALDGGRGQPVAAAADGTAYVYDEARDDSLDNFGFGNFVLLDHGAGYASIYAHLGGLSVQTGERVARGSIVGTIGASGAAGAPHLHFQVAVLLRTPDPVNERYHADYGQPPPPQAFDAPFAETVPFDVRVDRPDGLRWRQSSLWLRCGEAGWLPDYGALYRAP